MVPSRVQRFSGKPCDSERALFRVSQDMLDKLRVLMGDGGAYTVHRGIDARINSGKMCQHECRGAGAVVVDAFYTCSIAHMHTGGTQAMDSAG